MSAYLDAAGRRAVNKVVRQAKPLTARSIVASTLLGVERNRLSARLLVRSGELFGIPHGTTRVAISRMRASGDLIAHRNSYELAGSSMTARAERQAISRAGTKRSWDGAWKVAVVVHNARDARMRAALRQSAGRLRLGERREGVWMRPDNLPDGHDASQPDACRILATQCEHFRTHPVDDPVALAAMLFPVGEWAKQAEVLDNALCALIPALEIADMTLLGRAFVVGSSVLRHCQNDPLLPDELLPDDWPGSRIRADYERFDVVFQAAWVRCFNDAN